MTGFYQQQDASIILNIRLTPKASRNALLGVMEGSDGRQYLRISVNALPENGEANDELIRFLSKTLKRPKNAISIISGHNSREKRLKIETAGLDLSSVIASLGQEEAERKP